MPRARPLALTLTIGLLASIAAAPGQQGVFRSGTEMVPIYATVKDATGRLVPDLVQEDFVVLDNGREQPLAVFSNDIMPFSVVVMLDRSGSMFQHQHAIRDAATAFVRQLRPQDQARIGSFGNYVGNRIVIAPLRFTPDHDTLIETLRVPIGTGGNSPVWMAVDQSIAALHDLDGRRVVLLFSDGHDQPARSLMPVDLRQISTRLRDTEVMLYAVGFTEVQTGGGRTRVTPPHDGLRQLADESGGGYFEVRDPATLPAVFSRVAEELHRQYWLGFAATANDGRVHRIEVRVRRPGLTVRARQSYVAPSGGR
jgi:Ca-activated chloride channel family protein